MILDPLEYAFFQRALLAGLLASVTCGIVGTYVVVKRMASISGGLSHAAFGGVGLGYYFGFNPMIGAAIFALLSGAGIGWAYRHLRSALDTTIAMVWSFGMAIGVLFVSLSSGYAPDLMSYLFGSILFVPAEYLKFALALDVSVILVVALLFNEFQAVAFDEEYAQVVGIPVEPVFQILLALVSLSVVTLIRVVGVILVIALLTIPATIARQWCRSLGKMMIAATLIGAFCTTAGLYVSYWLSESLEVNVPTGPTIILIAVGLFVVSTVVRKSRAARIRKKTTFTP